MAEVNPSQKSPCDTCKALIIVQKEDGQVTVLVNWVRIHKLLLLLYTYTYALFISEVCSHVAGILFKVETACLNISDVKVDAIGNATVDQHSCTAWNEQ